MKPRAHVILYVRDPAASTAFYREVLAMGPSLEVPGMTEFRLGESLILGLMPEAGARRLFGDSFSPPSGFRAELYLLVDDPAAAHGRALAAGAVELSPLARRGWGDLAAYSLDPDGHVLAFARPA